MAQQIADNVKALGEQVVSGMASNKKTAHLERNMKGSSTSQTQTTDFGTLFTILIVG